MVAAHYKKDALLNCWTSSSDISGYHADFHEGDDTVGAGQGARHGMCELTNGMAEERHGRDMLCVNRPLVISLLKKHAKHISSYLDHTHWWVHGQYCN